TGWVGVKNSYHFGIAGYYAMMALEQDMIGITTTNANPLVSPTFSRQPLFGTNPLAVAIPAGKQPPFVADFATSPVSRGRLDEFIERDEDAPTDLLQDHEGNDTTDPSILTKGGAIRTLGGIREKGSHKGYCLTALVDIFSAVFSGANFGPLVVPTVDYATGIKARRDNGIGHFFGAMRIDAFRPAAEFKEDMDLWIQSFRSAQPVDGQEKVLIPGDPEREKEAERRKTGIPLRKSIVDDLFAVAGQFGLEFPDPVGEQH
ncbi:MAG: Ldh family oxidoreductase, partial [Bacteroidales bacterium]|nr:Ldh family oxidoreductase [Bacteroidales bacterium]